jgi:hypothetical protein
MRKERSRCNQACCRGEGADQFLISHYTMGYSTGQIGKMCGTSGTHIAMRLRALGIQMRSSKDYIKKGGRKKKKSSLWELSDKDLFETPMSVLMERFGTKRKIK